MIVAASREACVTYKNELDKILPKEYSEVVMTYQMDDSPKIQHHLKLLRERYHGQQPEDIVRTITDKFNSEEEYPKILIVTDMLLYGFDAPILQTIYLDKTLKEHRLLQAVARTNRPYKDLKEAGVIVDYVGVLSNFEKAFELYSGNEEIFSRKEVDDILVNISQMRQEFKKLLEKTIRQFDDIPKNKYDRGTLIDAVRVITSNERQLKTFLDYFISLRKKFELLGSDRIKAELISTYTWIVAVHTFYKLQEEGRKTEDEMRQEIYAEKYLSKTVKLAHKSTEIEQIKNLPRIEFNQNYLEELDHKVNDQKEKAADIIFTLNKLVLDRNADPVVEGIVEKVQRLMDKWKQKNENFDEMYYEGTSIIREINKGHDRQAELKLSDDDSAYSVLLVLEEKWRESKLVDDAKSLLRILRDKQLLSPGSFQQKPFLKQTEKEVRCFIRKNYVLPYKIGLSEIDELTKKIIEKLRYHSEK